jgi:hypothetical protein
MLRSMETLLVVVVVCLASARATRLLVMDTFPPVAVQRARVVARWGDGSWQAYLANCSWCAGMYVSGIVTGATWWAIDSLPVPALVWLAAAYVTGLLATVDETLSTVNEHLSNKE